MPCIWNSSISCARLTVTGVGEDSEYWFTFKTPASGEGKKLSNACTMTRLGGNKLNELEFSFYGEERRGLETARKRW